jgi:hemolysin activation/secretion protein
MRTPHFALSALFSALALAVAAMQAQAQAQAQQIELQPSQDCRTCSAASSLAQGMPAPQSVPAAPAAPSPSFVLNGIRLSGAQAFGQVEVDALTAPYIGRQVTLAELEALAQKIGERYRERGYFLAQAVVPMQTVQGGVVEISVIEGRLGKINVELAPDAPISEGRVRAYLSPLQPGEAISAAAYERAMLLLSDLPGLSVKSRLEEGTESGTTDLTVEVTAVPRWTFSANADNYGTRETGRYRAGGAVRMASPLGIGDNLDAQLMASNSGGSAFGRLSYEAPVGGSGLRAGLGVARVNYDLGGDFAGLNVHGTADIASLSLNYPVVRSRRQNLALLLSADTKRLKDNYDAVGFAPRKRVDGVSVGWTWELRDELLGGGYWASSGAWYHGRLRIDDPASRAIDQGAGGNRTAGTFDKLSFQLSRLQRINDRHSLYLSLGGQWTDKNLDASEKLALGGAHAVRAYASSELLVDKGVVGTAEWRWSVTGEWTPYAFFDAATGVQSDTPLPGATGNRQSLRGAGLGVQWSRPGDISVNASLAWRAGTRRAVADGGGHNPRLYVQLQKVWR